MRKVLIWGGAASAVAGMGVLVRRAFGPKPAAEVREAANNPPENWRQGIDSPKPWAPTPAERLATGITYGGADEETPEYVAPLEYGGAARLAEYDRLLAEERARTDGQPARPLAPDVPGEGGWSEDSYRADS